MSKCKRCNQRKVVCKEMCIRCYYATKREQKTYSEMLVERNYIKDSVGILNDKNGNNKWIVDIEDFNKCSRYLWIDNGYGYAKTTKVGYLHKFICPQWKVIDHIDRNPKNNQKSNLRDGSNGVNSLNKKTTAKSGYKAVYNMRGKWQARPKRISLGTFDTPEEAHNAVIKWAKKNNLIEFYII